jgi:hypothetical protein
VVPPLCVIWFNETYPPTYILVPYPPKLSVFDILAEKLFVIKFNDLYVYTKFLVFSAWR